MARKERPEWTRRAEVRVKVRTRLERGMRTEAAGPLRMAVVAVA